MVYRESNKGEELLEIAVQQFKQQSIAEFTNPIVHFPVQHESVPPAIATESRLRNPGRTRYTTRKLVLAALVMFVAFVSSLFMFPWASSGQRAFAQMQEAVRSLKTVVFETTTFHGDDVIAKCTVSYSQSGSIRMDSGLGAHVLNANQKEYMVVDDGKRTVRIEPVYNLKVIQEQSTGAFGSLLSLEPLATTTVQTVVIEGKPMREFKTVWDGSVATVTVDQETNLPNTIELDRGKGQDGKAKREVVSKFRFNSSLEDSLFAIAPPVGYQVDRIEKIDPIATSQELVLSPGEGMGPIRFGMSLQEVRNHLGDPDSFQSEPARALELDEKGQPKFPMKWIPADPPYRIGMMEYRSLGVRIDVSSIDGVGWIRCYEKRGEWNRFVGKTEHGIKIGMSKKEIQSLIEPSEWEGKSKMVDEGIWLFRGIDIHFTNDQCTSISISRHR